MEYLSRHHVLLESLSRLELPWNSTMLVLEDISEGFSESAKNAGFDVKTIHLFPSNCSAVDNSDTPEEISSETGSIDCAVYFSPCLASDYVRWSLQEVQRVIRPGGVVVVIEDNPCALYKFRLFSWLTRKVFLRVKNFTSKYPKKEPLIDKQQSRQERLPFRLPHLVEILVSLEFELFNFEHTNFLQQLIPRKFHIFCRKASSEGDITRLKVFGDPPALCGLVVKEFSSFFTQREIWLQKFPEYSNTTPSLFRDKIHQVNSALVLSPHPDDEIIGCGGTISQLLSTGARVQVVQLTDGSGSLALRNAPKEIDPQVRLVEAGVVAKQIGFSLETWKLIPGSNFLERPVITKLIDSIVRLRPEVIFLPFINDPHADHISTNQLLYQALQDASCREMNPRICGYEVWSLVPPTLYADITEEFSLKSDALLRYRWAMRVGDYVRTCRLLNAFHHLTICGKPGFAEMFFETSVSEYLAIYHRHFTNGGIRTCP